MTLDIVRIGTPRIFTRDTLYAVGTSHTENIYKELEERYLADPPTTLRETVQLCKSVSLDEDQALCIAITTPTTIHIVRSGTMNAYVARSHHWVDVLKSTDRISGPLKPGDRILLCTPSLVETYDTEQLKKSISGDKNTLTSRISELLSDDSLPESSGGLVLVHSAPCTDHPPAHRPSLQNTSTKPKLRSTKMKRALTAGMGTLLGILLITSMVVGSHQRAKKAREDELARVLGAVTSAIEDGAELVDTRPNDAYDLLLPVQAQLADELDSFPEDSAEYQRLVDTIARVSELIAQSSRTYSIDSPDVFLALSWITDDAQGARMHRDLDTIAIIDTDNGSLYTTSLSSKNNDIESSHADFASAIDVARVGKESIALTGLSDRRIISKSDVVLESFESESDPVALTGYADNLYVLDRKQNIIKLTSTEEGFKEPIDYLVEGTSVNLNSAVDIAIDGSIWIATKEDVLKFTGGNPDSYFMKHEQISDAKALYTDSESRYIYILEKGRVIVFDKSGIYQEQYTSKEFAGATDILVIDDATILVLKSDTIYQIDRSSR